MALQELFLIFAWRDIKVRYKQTFLGVGWAFFQPLISMFIFTIFFGRLAKIPSGDLPYSLFVLCGLVLWGFFSGTLTHASNSLVENENIVKKVYLQKPREVATTFNCGIIKSRGEYFFWTHFLIMIFLYFGFLHMQLMCIL